MSFHHIISEFRTKLKTPQSRASITQNDVEEFYKKLNNLRALFFKTYYQKYIENLNRVRPDFTDKTPDWSLLQIALAENAYKPTKPFRIFVHRIKYDYLLTSKPFVAYQKKQNRKKLNAPIKPSAEVTPPKTEKEWIRVPLPGNGPKKQNH